MLRFRSVAGVLRRGSHLRRLGFHLPVSLLWVAVLLGVGAVVEAQWSQWGGPNRDFAVDAPSLSTVWPEGGPKQLWKRTLGEGYSAIIAVGGRLYTMYREGEEEVVVALWPDTGKTVWEHRYAARIDGDAHPGKYGFGPRSTPLVVGARLFTIGFNGTMHCLDPRTGVVRWSKELLDEFDGTRRTWGYACSPLAHKDTVIVLVGGEDASIVALDQKSGAIVWKTHDFENSFGSPILIDVDGQVQLVCFMAKEVVGLDPDNGRLLWQHSHSNQWHNNISDPIWCEDNLLFISSEGNGGSRVLKLTRSGDTTQVREVWASQKMRISHRNAIRIGRYIYASNGDFGPAPFTAIEVASGRIAWKSRGLAEAGAVHADGKLILLDEDGHLALATVSPQAFTLHAKVKLLDHEAWTIPTLVGRRLFLRDRKVVMALELP